MLDVCLICLEGLSIMGVVLYAVNWKSCILIKVMFYFHIC